MSKTTPLFLLTQVPVSMQYKRDSSHMKLFFVSFLSPTNANLIYTFQPIFTALFAFLLLGETMGPAGFVGGGVIASAVFLVASTSFSEPMSSPTSDSESMSSLISDEKEAPDNGDSTPGKDTSLLQEKDADEELIETKVPR
jgi:drug/metabolite transporter (DMT)-like permease